MQANNSVTTIISELNKGIFNATTIVNAGIFLKNFKDSYCVLNECGELERLRYEIDHNDEKISNKAFSECLELKEKNSILQQCWTEAAEDLNKEKVKELLHKAQVVTANRLYSYQTILSFAFIARKLYILKLVFEEIRVIEELSKDPNLFTLIDEKLSEAQTELTKTNGYIENSLFDLASASLDYVSTKIEEINDDLNEIKINLSGQKAKLECVLKTSQDEAISNGFMSLSSVCKLINFKRLTTMNLYLGLLEALGYTALTTANFKLSSDSRSKIVELNQVIDETNLKLKKMRQIRQMIAKYKMEIAKQTEDKTKLAKVM